MLTAKKVHYFKLGMDPHWIVYSPALSIPLVDVDCKPFLLCVLLLLVWFSNAPFCDVSYIAELAHVWSCQYRILLLFILEEYLLCGYDLKNNTRAIQRLTISMLQKRYR